MARKGASKEEAAPPTEELLEEAAAALGGRSGSSMPTKQKANTSCAMRATPEIASRMPAAPPAPLSLRELTTSIDGMAGGPSQTLEAELASEGSGDDDSKVEKYCVKVADEKYDADTVTDDSEFVAMDSMIQPASAVKTRLAMYSAASIWVNK